MQRRLTPLVIVLGMAIPPISGAAGFPELSLHQRIACLVGASLLTGVCLLLDSRSDADQREVIKKNALNRPLATARPIPHFRLVTT